MSWWMTTLIVLGIGLVTAWPMIVALSALRDRLGLKLGDVAEWALLLGTAVSVVGVVFTAPWLFWVGVLLWAWAPAVIVLVLAMVMLGFSSDRVDAFTARWRGPRQRAEAAGDDTAPPDA